MSVRLKTFIFIGLVFLVSCAATWGATVTLVRTEYVKLEVNSVKKDTARAVDALNNSVNQLALKIPDWSSWDDAYTYSQDHNQAFVDSNVSNFALTNLHLNFMVFIGADQKLILASGVNVDTGDTIAIPPELTKALAPGGSLLATTVTSKSQGILRTSTYPLIIVTRPFLHNDGSGPVGGTLVFAQYLTPEAVGKLGSLTHLDLAFDPSTTPSGAATANAVGTSTTLARTFAADSHTISGFQLMNDIYGHPLLVAHVTEPRTIYQETQRTLVIYMAIVLSVSLAAILVTTYTTDRIARQTLIIANNKSVKAEIEKQVIERTHEVQIEKIRLDASINSLEVGFIMTNVEGELIIINHSARKLLGRKLSIAKLAALTLSDVDQLMGDKVNLHKILSDCMSNHRVVNLKDVDFDGKLLHLFAAPILTYSNGKATTPLGCVLLFEDTTEVTVAARSKDEFFSIASHELRTPLTAIRGNSSMMMQYYKDVFKDPALMEMLNDINESSIRLIAIVNDFLDVSRIEQGKIKFKFAEVKLDKIIESVVYDMESAQKKNDVHIKIDTASLSSLPTVAGDSDRVKQIIYNLVGNAVKFTDKGEVSITVSRFGNMLKVSVSDTGQGIEIESQKLLFHKFQQAGSSLLTRATIKGTGLGLYISKLLVEGMGGNIALDRSEVGVGSTFSFTIPIATEELLKHLRNEETKKGGKVNIQTGLTTAKHSK